MNFSEPRRLAVSLLTCLFAASVVDATDCESVPGERNTDDYAYVGSSDQGVPGDIVAIDVGLDIDRLHEGLVSLGCVACFDPNALQLVEIAPTPILDSLSVFPVIKHLGVGDAPRSETGQEGILLASGVELSLVGAFIKADQRIPLVTLYFRITGAPGSSATVRFCDDVWTDFGGSCVRNTLVHWVTADDQLQALSTEHVSGTVRILEGTPTRTELPDLPPPVKVYPEAPTPEDARVRFELDGGVARPGGEVAVDLTITSNFEFSGFTAELDYPVSLLQLLEVEERIRPGAVRVNEDMGIVGLALGDSTRRIGKEGEPVVVATYHFRVTDAASSVESVEIGPADLLGVGNTVRIQYAGGAVGIPVPAETEIRALEVSPAVLKIQRQPVRPGDVNLDYKLNVADAVGMLTELFSGGGGVECRGAEDFNGDHEFDLSDPVALLNHLFAGGPSARSEDVFCR